MGNYDGIAKAILRFKKGVKSDKTIKHLLKSVRVHLQGGCRLSVIANKNETRDPRSLMKNLITLLQLT